MPRKAKKAPSLERKLEKPLSQTVGKRVDCFGVIVKLLQPPNPVFEIPISKLEATLKVSRKTVLKICAELKALFALGLVITRGTFCFGQMSYFQKQLLTAPDHKDAISDAFVNELAEHPVRGLAAGPGTTARGCMAKLIPKRNLYSEIITNNLGILELLDGQTHTPCIMAGGLVNRDINAVLGGGARESFSHANYDAGLIGISGLSREGKLHVQYYEEIEVLKQISQSVRNRIYVVAAIEKLAMEDTHEFASISELLDRNSDLEIVLITTPLQEISGSGNSERVRKAKSVLDMLRGMDRVKVIIAELPRPE